MINVNFNYANSCHIQVTEDWAAASEPVDWAAQSAPAAGDGQPAAASWGGSTWD